ncbi:phage tail-collar fiber domain-containing protein [Pseudomonas promysalinigenes]
MVDQNSQFYAILTNVGAAKQANADALGIAWKITHMGVGDANGADPTPDATQTRLINEWRRAPLNQLKVDDKDASIIIAEQVIPADIGGKWIREIGLYDEAGDLVAVANCAPTYKPVLSQGSGRTQVLRMSLVVSSAANVQLKIDPSVVLATREWVTEELARQDFKHSVLAATTANIALSGLQTIDGVPLTAGARVLVKNQTTARDNGLYTVVPGAAWSRCDDANSSAKVTPGLLVLVEKGTVNSDSAWQLVTDAPITLGVTALSFEMAFGRSGVAAGTYRSVQVDKYGRVVAATNPTTVAGYGITDVYTKSETFSRAETTSAIATAVASAVAGLVDSSPAALDTLKELAMAIGNDPNFATTMVNELAKKAPLVSPVLTGDPRAPTPSVGDNDTSIATTAFVQAAMAAFGVGTQSPVLITDLNLATSGGFWRAAGGAANSVGTGAVTGFTVPYNGTGCLQILSQLTAAGSPLHWRSQVAGVWSDWTPFAGLLSPVLTGDPKAPTPPVGDSDTSIATTAFVQEAMKAFGLGQNKLATSVADIDDPTLATGWYQVGSVTTGNKPETFGILLVSSRNSVNATTGRINQIFYRTDGAVWAAWGRVWKAGFGGWSDWSTQATLESPVFTGDPKAPTPSTGDNDTSVATTAFVHNTLSSFGMGTGTAAGVGAGTTPEQFAALPAGNYYYQASVSPYPDFAFVMRCKYQTTRGFELANIPYQDRFFGRASNADGTWRAPIELAKVASPVLTGDVGVPTRITTDRSANAASTQYVANLLASLGWGTPDLLDLATGIDLNTLNVGGSYQVNGAANGPAFQSGILFVVGTNAQYYTHQLFFPQNVNKIFHRCSYGATNGVANWTAWEEVPTLDSVLSAISNTSRSFRPQAAVGLATSQALNTTTHMGALFQFNANALTVTLPSSVSVTAGMVVTLRNPRASTQTLAVASGSIVEEGGTSDKLSLQAYEWIELTSSGSNWFVSARGKVKEVATLDQLTSAIASATPPGMVGHFALTAPPPGWLKRNGAAVSRITYAALFTAVGTQFGAGDGSTTFNLPDDRELVDRAWTDGLNSADLGRALFSAQADQLGIHNHTGTVSAGGAHSHTTTVPRERIDSPSLDTGGNAVLGDYQSDGPQILMSSTAPNHSHGLTINASGGNETRMANRAYLACIKY